MGNPLRRAKFSDAVFAAKAIQNNSELIFCGILFARGPFAVFDNLLAKIFNCLSQLPPLGSYNEPETLSDQIALFGPIGTDVRQVQVAVCSKIADD